MSQVESNVNTKMKLHAIQTEVGIYFLITVSKFKWKCF